MWAQVNQALEQVGERLFGIRRIVANPVLHVLVPGMALALSGVRLTELGLRRGCSSWAVAAPYSVFLALFLVMKALPGDARIIRLALLAPVVSFFNNGFSEEFLFRGALQTRLSQLLGEAWGLVLTALLFGIVHLGGLIPMLEGDALAALGLCLTSQAAAGLVFGILAVRTRSLIVPTVAHITLNLFG